MLGGLKIKYVIIIDDWQAQKIINRNTQTYENLIRCKFVN